MLNDDSTYAQKSLEDINNLRNTKENLQFFIDNLLFEFFRNYGHLFASISKLGPVNRLNIDLSNYLLKLNNIENMAKLLSLNINIKKELEEIYCKNIGFEFFNCNIEEKEWLYNEVENRNYHDNAKENNNDKENNLFAFFETLKHEKFEEFLHKKFPGAKRFSCQGIESALVAGSLVIKFHNENIAKIKDDQNIISTNDNINNNISNINQNYYSSKIQSKNTIIIAAAHRGRLSLLCNILHKPIHQVFQEFLDFTNADTAIETLFQNNYCGDVKYHKGFNYNAKNHNIILLPNPSHLEAVNSVAQGLTRAIQDFICRQEGIFCYIDDVNFNYNESNVSNNNSNVKCDNNFNIRDDNLSAINNNKSNANNNKFKSLDNDEFTNELLNKLSILPILFHGDSAFSGQGVVAEGLNCSNLKAYTVNGSIHIIMNNMIGYTTNPIDSRSSCYATDFAKTINAPILHINSANLSDLIFACNLAVQYRIKFKKDIILDILGYRKYGHNEADDPSFTQSNLYKIINQQNLLSDIYKKDLIRYGYLTKNHSVAIFIDDFNANLEDEYKIAEEGKIDLQKFYYNAIDNLHNQLFFKVTTENFVNAKTSENDSQISSNDSQISNNNLQISKHDLIAIAKHLTSWPENFNINKKLSDILSKKNQLLINQEQIDWGLAESLAFGCLIKFYVQNIRLVGQDVIRGTFSSRHAIMFDSENDVKQYCPLKNIHMINLDQKKYPINHQSVKYQSSKYDSSKFTIYNSSLSEYFALGFEYGYALLKEAQNIVIWEAQFGDFANGAKTIIDQFIMSAKEKWNQESSLIMFLPHGYEGQGPEHSSARIESFLSQAANDNIQICIPTSPASFAQLLLSRGSISELSKNAQQILMQDYNNVPLIVFTPKSLLRLDLCKSYLDELIDPDFIDVFMLSKNIQVISVNYNNKINNIINHNVSFVKFKQFLHNKIIITDIDNKIHLDTSLDKAILEDFASSALLKNSVANDHFKNSVSELPLKSSELIANNSNIMQSTNIILCYGKIYYDILAYLKQNFCNENNKNSIITDQISQSSLKTNYINPKNLLLDIIRIEQLYPFDALMLQNIIEQIKQERKIHNIIIIQEEPENMGAQEFIKKMLLENQFFMQDKIYQVNYIDTNSLFFDINSNPGHKINTNSYNNITTNRDNLSNKIKIHFIARKRSSSPACGSFKLHIKELSVILDQMLKIII